MADDRIDVKITVDASQAKAGFKEVEDSAAKMGDQVSAAGAQAAAGMKPLEVTQRQMRELIAAAGGDANKAMKALGEVGGEADKALQKLGALKHTNKDLLESLKGVGKTLADNLQSDARHLIAIFDESMHGQRGAMIASISALARDSGALDIAMKGVGATATWFATTPMGQVTAVIAGIVATIGIGIAKLIDMEAELRRVGGEALAMGRAPEEAVKGYEKLKGVITAEEGKHAEATAQAIERIPSLSEAARAAIAKIAPAMLAAQYGGDLKQFEKHLPGVFGSSAEMTAFVERYRLLGGEQLAAFLGASRATQAEMLAQALATRYGPYAEQLKKARDMVAGGPQEPGREGQSPFIVEMFEAMKAARAVPAAPLVMPSQADIDAIEAIRKASPHKLTIEALQQQIKTIEAGLAELPESLQAQGKAAIVELQTRIDKLQAMPGYQSGGIVRGDQLAQLHAGEMVLPADVSAMVQGLAQSGGGNAAAVASAVNDAAQKLDTASTSLATTAGSLDLAADAINSMTKGLETGLDNALFGTRRRALGVDLEEYVLRAGLKSLTSSLLKDLQAGLTSLLFGGGAASLGAGFSNLLFGSGELGGLAFGSRGLSGLLGIGEGGLASAAFGQAISSTGIFPAIGSWLGGLFGGGAGFANISAGFLGLAKGGIVPAAAGGWVVPHFQAGGILSVLHQREMVLPAHLSDGLQSMIARGGGGHTFNLNVQAWDGRSVMNAGPQIVAAVNRAIRNGSALNVPA
jgi:hypothetical protein